MNQIRAELRKIFTIRSTYFLMLVILLLPIGLISGVLFGYNDSNQAVTNVNALKTALLQSVSVSALLLSFIAVTSVGHEYRYNTILYSLTSVNRRSKLFFAKAASLALVGLVIGFVSVILSAAAFYVGLNLHGSHAVAQAFPDIYTVGRIVAVLGASMLFAFIITTLIRSLIGAIALLLILPSTVEPLLALLLKDNAQYLPYTAVGNMTATNPTTSLNVSLLVLIAYIIGVGAVAYALFMRRDAS